MPNRDLADCSRPLLCPPAPCNNRGDTNRCTIPRRCRPYHKGRNRSEETISPARCRHTHLQPRLCQEIVPATCSTATFHQDELHRRTHKSFLISRRAPQIQTPLQSADAVPTTSRRLRRP